jgi:hypothetical protein
MALILESFVGSIYTDRPDSYEFPPQYLKFFEPLTRGEPIVAVIYEPRGGSGGKGELPTWGGRSFSQPQSTVGA